MMPGCSFSQGTLGKDDVLLVVYVSSLEGKSLINQNIYQLYPEIDLLHALKLHKSPRLLVR